MLEGKVLDDRFALAHRIGEGTFCSVYLATDQNTLKKVAVKVLKDSTAEHSFRKELSTLKELANAPGLAKYYASGSNQPKYIVMELLTTDMLQVFRANGALPVAVLLKIAKETLIALESIHSQGYLHLDIKPDNIAIKRKEREYKCYLVDLGMAAKYSRSGTHYQYAETGEFHGNPVFASINTLKGCRPSRRDDLESLLYALAYLGTSTLPWANLQRMSFGVLRGFVADKKQMTSHSVVFKGLPGELGQILELVKSLSFAEKPNYMHYFAMVESAARRLGLELEDTVEWDRLIGRTVRGDPASPLQPIVSPIPYLNESMKIKQQAEGELQAMGSGLSRDFRRTKTKKLTDGLEKLGFGPRSNTRHLVLPPKESTEPHVESLESEKPETEFKGRRERGKDSTLVTANPEVSDRLRSTIDKLRQENAD